MDELNAADILEQLLDDAPPTLLDFLDALEVWTRRPTRYRYRNCAGKTTSNTWRQRRRLEMLRLRDEVKQLDAEPQENEVGSRGALHFAVNGRATQMNRPAVKRLLGESWQDAASRESVTRQIANADNERLHRVLHMQVKHARKLHRMTTQQMTASVVAQALGYRPAFSGDESRPPTKLLAEMDGHRGDVNSIFVTDSTDQECGSKKEGHVSVHHARGLKVQIVNSYAVPYSVEATEQAIWNILTEREGNDKNSRVAYNEFYIRRGISYEEVVWRTVQQGKDRFGASTAVIETHMLATFPTYKTLSCLSPEGLRGFHDSLMRFNHKVEDVLVSKIT
ncbi:hypothetical protein GQ600_14403 [Phytophthora cactorum]|nr:hypothetical protein GQ600_14403 [Phytophthora cactorum]